MNDPTSASVIVSVSVSLVNNADSSKHCRKTRDFLLISNNQTTKSLVFHTKYAKECLVDMA